MDATILGNVFSCSCFLEAACLLLTNVTAMQFWDYTIASAVGIIPGVCLFTLIGRLASSTAEVVNGDVKTSPGILIGSIVISIVFMLVVVVLLTRYARRALADQFAREAASEPDQAAQPSQEEEGGKEGEENQTRDSHRVYAAEEQLDASPDAAENMGSYTCSQAQEATSTDP
jgi:hypothetical protein